MSSKRVYLGIGAGGEHCAFRAAAEHAIRSYGYEPIGPPVVSQSTAVTAELILTKMADCAASFVLIAYPFHDDPELAERRLDVLEAEYEATLTRRSQQDSEELLPSRTGMGHQPRAQAMILLPPVASPSNPQDNVTYASLTRLSGSHRPRFSELVDRARRSHGVQDEFDTADQLAIVVAAMLVRSLNQRRAIHVMLSSTTKDLEAEYQIIDRVFRRLGCKKGTEYHPIRFTDKPTLEQGLTASLAYVRQCGLFIGIVKDLAGTPVAQGSGLVNEPRDVTFTEAEFMYARELSRPRGYLVASGNAQRPVNAPIIPPEQAAALERLRQFATHDDGAPFEEFCTPADAAHKMMRLIDWMGKPGRDRVALPPPNDGLVYVAHEYTLVEPGSRPLRQDFVRDLNAWWDDPDGASCLNVLAFGGMGKSAATWAWFAEITGPVVNDSDLQEKPLYSIWWSFYSPESDYENFLRNAVKFLYPRLNNRVTFPQPQEDADVAIQKDCLVRLLRCCPGKVLFVFDGLERVLQFYREQGFDARLTEGPAIDEHFEARIDDLAQRLQVDRETARRALLSLADGTSDLERLRQLAGEDSSPFADFFRELTALRRVRILVSSRFTPTVLTDLENKDIGQAGTGRCQTIAMRGLTEEEAKAFWLQSGLKWDDTTLPVEDGGDQLRDVLVENLGGYALPIALLAGLIRENSKVNGSFTLWKQSLDPIARRDSLHTWPVDSSVLWVVHHVLDQVDVDSLGFRILSHVLGEANATDYPSLRQAFIRRNAEGGSVTDASLDQAIDGLRNLKLLGRDAHGYRYELHPLVRRAIQSFDLDTRVSVGTYLAETRQWIVENDKTYPGVVPTGLVEELWSRIAKLVEAHAPRAAVVLFEDLDLWIRYRSSGNVVQLRGEYLQRLERELQRLLGLLAASDRGDSSKASAARTEAAMRSLQQVRAWMADNLQLSHKNDEALAMAQQQTENDYARLIVAQCHESRLEFELAIPEYEALALTPQRTSASLRRWAACGYARCLGQCGLPMLAMRIIRMLRRAYGSTDADVEFTALAVAETGSENLLDEELARVKTATQDRLVYGSHWYEIKRLQLKLDQRLSDEYTGDIDKTIMDARMAGFLNVAHEGELLKLRRQIEVNDIAAAAGMTESLLAAAREAGDRRFYAEVVSHAARSLLLVRKKEEVIALVLESLKACRSRIFQQVQLTQRLENILPVLGMTVDDPAVREAVRELHASIAPESSQELEASVNKLAGEVASIANTAGWTDDQVIQRLEDVKSTLDWGNTSGSARKWWEAFENENTHRRSLVLRLAEELAVRKATITEFFLAYAYSNTDNIQANLFYLDYTRLKKAEEKKKKLDVAVEERQVLPEGSVPSLLDPTRPDVLRAGISETKDWTDDDVVIKLEETKSAIDWENTTGSARKWWDAFETENIPRRKLVLRLAEELAVRKATITEFFLAYVYSNTDNIQANLFYLDYTRLKKQEEQKKREKQSGKTDAPG